jgi:hypothetical protein
MTRNKQERKVRSKPKQSAIFKVFDGVYGWFKSWDMFGQSIPFNIDGEDTFKSMPGACLSIWVLSVVLLYLYIKADDMVNHKT